MSGLYEGLFVMRDESTSSEWLHYTGECIVGPRAGRALPMLDTTAMTWRAFRGAYPEGTTIPPAEQWWRRVMGRLFGSRGGVTFLSKTFRDTMHAGDARLPEGELGLGVFVGRRSLFRGTSVSAARFYPFDAVRKLGFVADQLGDVPIVVHYGPGADSPIALVARLDDGPVDLVPAGDGRLRDRASGSVFNAVGRCMEGPMAGKRLPLAPSVWTRWYGFVQTYPETSIWQPLAG